MKLDSISLRSFASRKSEIHAIFVRLQGTWLQTETGLRLVWKLRIVDDRLRS
jgi:hypothetical protein